MGIECTGMGGDPVSDMSDAMTVIDQEESSDCAGLEELLTARGARL